MATVGGMILGAGASATTAAVVGTAAVATAAVVGTQVYMGRKARKANERAMAVDEKRAKIQSMRSSVQQIRAAQLQAAEIRQAGENQSVGGSSGVAGGIGSVKSQATGNIAFAQDVFNLQKSYNRLRQQGMKYQYNAQAIGQIGNAVMPFAKDYVAGQYAAAENPTFT